MKALTDDDVKRNLKERSVINPDGCWVYGQSQSKSYPPMMYKGKVWRAYQVSYMLFRGPIPKDRWICLTCNNIRCVNPYHLMPYRPYTKEIRRCRGADCPLSKLTDAKVRNILQDFGKSKMSIEKIGRKYDVAHNTIQRIVAGKSWKHVDRAVLNVDHDEINRRLQKVSDKDAKMFRMVHGIRPFTRSDTLRNVGKQFKISGERVRQVENRTLAALELKRPLHSTGFVFVAS